MSTILHLGVGAFHRAHQAAYMQRLRQTGERADLRQLITVGAGAGRSSRDHDLRRAVRDPPSPQ